MKATTGGIIIESGEQVKESEGGIFIPQTARQVKSKIGKVVAVTPYPVGRRAKLWQGGSQGGRKKVTISQAHHDRDAALLGEHVLLEEGQLFRGEDKRLYVKGKVEHVIAIVEEPDTVKLVANEIQRCPRCKSKGESNLLLDDKGYCPNCCLNPAGEHRNSYDGSKVSDDLSDHMAGRTNREATMQKNGTAEKGTIMSYAGQTKRSALKTKN